jgi:hypothetical protein
MRAHRSLRSALTLTLLLACDGDDGGISDDDTCKLIASLSGDVTAELPGSDGVACLSQFSGGSDGGIDVEYVPLDNPDLAVSLKVLLVARGMTGTGFPATVRVFDGAGKHWQSATCLVDITEHDSQGPVELGEGFRARGTGKCSEPLTEETTAGTVTLDAFEFVAVITWTG